MKILTEVDTLAPGDKFYIGDDERTVERVEVITPSPAAALVYDDFRGAGPAFLRVWFEDTYTSTDDGATTHSRLVYKDYPRHTFVFAGEGL